jgi:hypothetical protein
MQSHRTTAQLLLTASLILTMSRAGAHAAESIIHLLQAPDGAGPHVRQVGSYYKVGGPGGGAFSWDAACRRSTHNGGTIISPTVPWDGRPGSTHIDFLAGRGETQPDAPGCWKRPPASHIRFTEWGGRGDWNGTAGTDNQPVWKQIRARIGPEGAKVHLDPGYANDYWFGNTVIVARDNVEVIIPPGVTARSTKPTSQGSLFSLGPVWYRIKPEPAAVQNVGLSGGGTIITTSPGDNENSVALSKVHRGWVRDLSFPAANRKAITMQYDYEDIVVERNRIGRTGHDAITVQGLFEAAAGNPSAPHRRVQILNNSIQSAGRHGFLAQRNFAASMSDIVVRGNTIVAAASSGIAFNGVDSPVIQTNVVEAARVGAWFLRCSRITGDVDVRNLGEFGLFMNEVDGYDFSSVSIARAANDAIRDDRRAGAGHIGRLRIVGAERGAAYRASAAGRGLAPVIIESFATDSTRATADQFKAARRGLKPQVRAVERAQ